jgi:hypothetical protein
VHAGADGVAGRLTRPPGRYTAPRRPRSAPSAHRGAGCRRPGSPWRRRQQREDLHEHIGCVVLPEPASEGQPRPRAVPAAAGPTGLRSASAPGAAGRRPGQGPQPTGGPPCRGRRTGRPAGRPAAPAAQDIWLCSLATSGTRGATARGSPPGTHRGRAPGQPGPSGPPASRQIGCGRPLQAVRRQDIAHPVGLSGQSVTCGKLQSRRRRVTGEQDRRDHVPAQLRGQPQREQLRPARLQRVQHPDNPYSRPP